MNRIPVAVLGATGTVGQKFITLLEGHSWFTVEEVVASSRSAGKQYKEACNWKQPTPIPKEIAEKIVKTTDEKLNSPLLFSGLDSSVAGPAEEKYANDGHFIISNSKNHRMDADVPLVIPELNADHFDIISKQPYKGGIVTNSNCSTMFLAMVLGPLHQAFGVSEVQVSTMQAISGAGYPGVPSMDILGNIVPYISGEEEKLEIEPQKILGSYKDGTITPAKMKISAQCARVPVFDGHTETLSIKFHKKPTPEQVKKVLADFTGEAQKLGLPSAPSRPIVVHEEPNRPQPFLDAWLEKGMVASVGRVRECSVLDIKMVIMGHNTVRGAAGAAILNGEALVKKGYIKV